MGVVGLGFETEARFTGVGGAGAPFALRGLAVIFGVLALLLSLCAPAFALEPIVVKPDADRIEITTGGELYNNRGDTFQVETASGLDGTAGRMSVSAQTSGTNPNWLVFALTNPTDQRIQRWLTADRYAVVGSGAVWPDLDARRIEAVTPSIGFLPEKVESDRADVYSVTLEPGQTITFVAELSSERYARIYLWKPLAYELKVRERQLFNGIMLGLTGLLAIFLTVIFAANHKAIFPSAALVAWCVLAYLCVDFGFFHKLFNLRPEDNAVYRAAGEASIAASLVIFLYTFLRLSLGHSIVRMLVGVWMVAQLALIAVAVIDPRLAATFARLSFFLIGGVGAAFTLFLAFKGQDRAISLIPTWILFLVWVFGAAVILTGRMSGDVVVAGLVAGLVLIVVLLGFTVTQFAFRSGAPVHAASPGDQELRVLAVNGARAATWEWLQRRNEVRVSPIVEAALGLNGGELSAKTDEFVNHIHPSDRDRFNLTLWSMRERGGGQIQIDFRLRASDNSYRWYELEAASVETADRRNLRCVGLLRDITDSKRSQERLLHDAVHCSLTGLPNRELFVDRLLVAAQRAAEDESVRPTVLFLDIDKFKSVNDSLGLVVGDSLLLTVARRLQRYLEGQDTLARLSGDQFAILLMSEHDPRELASLAERIRRSLRSPIKIAGREIVLTGSIGIAIFDGQEESHLDLLKEAEVAMYRAKRAGADRIEIFGPQMRGEQDDRVTIESDLRVALQKKQIKVLFQPIVYLPTEELAGFEALVRWEHPTRGLLNPDSFVPVAEESDLIVLLGSYVLARSVATLGKWQRILPRSDSALFMSVNISARQLMRSELIQEVRQITARSVFKPGSLRLEITESLAMANPEQAVERMEQIRASGAQLALDDFGTGYSSLAYLQRFPVDTIKLDRAIVQTSHVRDGPQSAIVRAMVALAHELGKNVVAEGVELPEDAGFLRSIGCEYAQGFYYGEPMTEGEVVELLRIIRKSERKLETQGFFRTKPKKTKDKKKPGKTEGAETAKRAASKSGGTGPTATNKAAANGGVGAGVTKPGAGEGGMPPGSTGVGAGKPGAAPVGPVPPVPPVPGAPAAKQSGRVKTPPKVPAKSFDARKAAASQKPPPLRQVPVVGKTDQPTGGANPLAGARNANGAGAPAEKANPAGSARQGVPVSPNNKAPSETNPSKPLSPPKQPEARPSGISKMLDDLPPLPVDPAASGSAANGQSGGRATPGGLDPADLSALPPGIAASLARLAGSSSGGPRRLSQGGTVAKRSPRSSLSASKTKTDRGSGGAPSQEKKRRRGTNDKS